MTEHLVEDLHVLRRPGRVGRRGGEGRRGRRRLRRQGRFARGRRRARRQGRDGGRRGRRRRARKRRWIGRSRRGVRGRRRGRRSRDGDLPWPGSDDLHGKARFRVDGEGRGGHPFVELLDHFLGRNVPAADDSEVSAALGRRFRERRVRVLERRADGRGERPAPVVRFPEREVAVLEDELLLQRVPVDVVPEAGEGGRRRRRKGRRRRHRRRVGGELGGRYKHRRHLGRTIGKKTRSALLFPLSPNLERVLHLIGSVAC